MATTIPQIETYPEDRVPIRGERAEFSAKTGEVLTYIPKTLVPGINATATGMNTLAGEVESNAAAVEAAKADAEAAADNAVTEISGFVAQAQQSASAAAAILGATPWGADEPYEIGRAVWGDDGNVYTVVTPSTGVDPVTDTTHTYWQRASGLPDTTSEDIGKAIVKGPTGWAMGAVVTPGQLENALNAETTAWNDVTDKPDAFPAEAHSHAWGEVTEKPDVFPPAAHDHAWDEVTGKPDAFPPAAHDHAWDEVTGKPDAFPPSAHTHPIAAITGLQAALDDKSATEHTHTVAQITNAGTAATRDVGTAPGNVPVLDAEGKLAEGVLPDQPPTTTGACTTNGTTDNALVLTGIVPALALEIGDVIQITGSTGGLNDKLFTVEAIIDDASIIVNYEHAGNRADGSLKLTDETADITITRVAKWYNAPIGLGQAWVDVTWERFLGTTYTNNTGRAIYVMIQINDWAGGDLVVNGITAHRSDMVNAGDTISMVIPGGGTYYIEGVTMANWLELR